MTLLVTHNCINIRKKTGERQTQDCCFTLSVIDSGQHNKKTISLAIQRSLHSLTQSHDKKVRPYFTVKFTMNFPNMPKLTDKPEDIQ